MNKKLLIALGSLVVFFIISIVFIIVFSFSYVKKNTDAIIRLERDKLVNLIRIPNAVPPSNPNFYSITYTWEMETLEKEVTSVRVISETAYSKIQNKILVVLEKPEAADSSVFNKVLPAVIVDKKSLNVALSQDQQTYAAGEGDFYNFVKIERDKNLKVVKVIWEIDKEKFTINNQHFENLNKLPGNLFKILYNIQKTLLLAFAA